jgi:hypothetical protein
MTWECSTLLIHIGELAMTLAACTYLFKLDPSSLLWATAVYVQPCFITSATFAMPPWYCSQRVFTSRTDSSSRLLQKFLGTTSKTGPARPKGHSPYSPDLAPCDFYLFPKLKLKGHHFGTVTLTESYFWSLERMLEQLCNFPRVVLWRR